MLTVSHQQLQPHSQTDSSHSLTHFLAQAQRFKLVSADPSPPERVWSEHEILRKEIVKV